MPQCMGWVVRAGHKSLSPNALNCASSRCRANLLHPMEAREKFWCCCCSVVDFGAGWFDLNWAFSQQRAMNPPGKSPPMCSEF